MEDENYRALVVTRINRTLERKVGPDDHIEDVQVSKPVWKGMLRMVQAMITGMEHSYLHQGVGGMASCFQILEIAHTHYWAKESTQEESSVTTTATCSQGSSPFGSNDNIDRLAGTPEALKMASPSAVEPSIEISAMVDHKRNSLMNRIQSIESEVSEDVSPSCNASEAGSMTVNPVYGTRLLSTNSYRSTYSDSEIEVNFGLFYCF